MSFYQAHRGNRIFGFVLFLLMVLTMPGQGGAVIPGLQTELLPFTTARHTPGDVPPGLNSDTWHKIRTAIERDQYRFQQRNGDVYAAPNQSQGLTYNLTPEGLEIEPISDSEQWRIGLSFISYGYAGNHQQIPETREVELNANRIEYRRGDLTEWYINDARGLEQGFTLRSQPPREGGSSPLELRLGSTSDLEPFLMEDEKGIAFRDEQGRTLATYNGLHSWDKTGQVLASRMAVDGKEITLVVDDRDAVYPIVVDPFIQTKKLLASDAAFGDGFGGSVAISGDLVIVGTRWKESAYIFSRNQGGANNWGEVKKLVASDGAASDYFGLSVSIHEGIAIVGAYLDDDNGSASGSAYIFSRDQGGVNNWGQVKKLVAGDGVAEEKFGSSVSITADTAIVGASEEDGLNTNRGAAYVFYRNQGGSNNWGEVKKLLDTEIYAGSIYFGNSVSINGDTIIVGAFRDDDKGSSSGSVSVFHRNQDGVDNWGLVKKLLASDGAANDFFGVSASIDGDMVVVGAKFNDDKGSDSGSAYVFSRNLGGADNWGEVKKLIANDGVAGDQFGMSVSISADTAIVGAYLDDDKGSGSGSAYIFSRDQGGANNWGEAGKLVAADGAADDQFGYSVSISGGRAVVGSIFNDGAVSNSGSAYVYSTNQAYPISVTVGPNGSVSADSGPISACTSSGGICTGEYAAGSNVILTSTPAAGYATAWTGTDSGSCTNNTCTFNSIDSAKSVTASFSLNSYTVSASVDANGLLDSISRIVSHGSSASFTVSPKAGYTTDTAVDGTCASGAWSGTTYTTGAVTSACSVSFTHSPVVNSYKVSATVDANGTLNVTSRTVSHGSSASFTVTAKTGYTTNQKVGGTCTDGSWSGTTYTTGAVTSACSVSFTHSPVLTSYKVSATVDTNGTLNTTSRTVAHGATASFTVTPKTGYLTNAAVDGTCASGSWSGMTYTTGAVTSNCSVDFSHTKQGTATEICSGTTGEISNRDFIGETRSCVTQFRINMGPWVSLEGQSNVSLASASIAVQPPLQVAKGSVLKVNTSLAGVASLNQAHLGPLAGATIRAYLLTDLFNPIEGPVSSLGSTSDLNIAGRFGLALPGIADTEWVLVSASGGYDIDPDDDGAVDSPPTLNKGTLYGLAQASEWRNGKVQVTALSDLVWRFTRSLVTEVSPAELHIRLADLAKAFLLQDINGDGQIDWHDLHAFVPRNADHWDKLNFDYQALLDADDQGRSVIGAHHAGDRELLERLLDNVFGAALNLYPTADPRYQKVNVEVLLFGRGKVTSDIGGILVDTEAAPATNMAKAWFTRDATANLTLTATPIASTSILGWSGCDSVSVDLTQCTVDLGRTRQVVPKFGYTETLMHAAVHDMSGATAVLGAGYVNLSILPSDTELVNSLLGLKDGDFIAGPTDTSGYLRKVISFERIDNLTYKLETEDASPAEVVAQGTGGFSKQLTNGDLLGYSPGSSTGNAASFNAGAFQGIEGVTLVPSEDPHDTKFRLQFGAAASEGIDPRYAQSLAVTLWSDGANKLSAQGSLDITIALDSALAYKAESDKNLSDLEQLSLFADLKQSADLKFSYEGTTWSLASSPPKVKVASISFGSIKFFIGWLPVWIEPEIEIFLGADGQVKASLTAGIKVQKEQKVGVLFNLKDGGWKNISEPPFFSWDFIKPSLNAEAILKGYLEARVQVEFYSLFDGPSVGGETYVLVHAVKPVLNEDVLTGQGCQDGLELSIKAGVTGSIKWEAAEDIKEKLKIKYLPQFEFSFLKKEWLLKHWYLDGQCAENPPFLTVAGDNMEEVVDSTNRHNVQKSYLLKNTGSGKLPWSVEAEKKDAISISPTSGDLLAGESAYVVVEVNTSTLKDGTYKNKLWFKNNLRSSELWTFEPLGTTVRYVEIKLAPPLSIAPIIENFEDKGSGFGKIFWSFDHQSAPVDLTGYEIQVSTNGGVWNYLATVHGIESSERVVSGLALDSNSCFRMQAYGEEGVRTPYSAEDCHTIVGNKLRIDINPGTSITETGSMTAKLTREGYLANTLVVNLDSSELTEATVPATVTIPATASSADFTVTAVDDAEQDGDQEVILTAYVAGWDTDTATLTVVDDEATDKLILEFDSYAPISENGGSIQARVRRDGDLKNALTVTLASNDTTEARVPGTVIIPAGQDNAGFVVTAVNDAEVDFDHRVIITASATGYIDGREWLTVTDDDRLPGFSYTKLDWKGESLPDSANSWECVKDNRTGLTWEAKTYTDLGQYTDTQARFTWYDAQGVGYKDSYNSCFYGSRGCDTLSYVQRINTDGEWPYPPCGITNWRMPTLGELSSLLDPSQPTAQIDLVYFPYIPYDRGDLWTSTLSTMLSPNEPISVNFYYGGWRTEIYSERNHVMLVSDGPQPQP